MARSWFRAATASGLPQEETPEEVIDVRYGSYSDRRRGRGLRPPPQHAQEADGLGRPTGRRYGQDDSLDRPSVPRKSGGDASRDLRGARGTSPRASRPSSTGPAAAHGSNSAPRLRLGHATARALSTLSADSTIK